MARPKQIDPKPTRYRNILYDSRLEARWAVLIDNTPNILHCVYHPETWKLPNGWEYTPDFLITYFIVDHRPCKLFLEIKPAAPNEEYYDLLQEFTRYNHKLLFLISGPIYRDVIDMQSCMIEKGKPGQSVPVYNIFQDFLSTYLVASNYRFDL